MSVLSSSIVASIVLGVLAAGATTASAEGELVLSSWGGSAQDVVREVMIKPFEEETGIKVIETTGPELIKIKTMVDAGNTEFDVANTVSGDQILLAEGGYLEPIDYNMFDKKILDGFVPEVVRPHGIGFVFYSKVIAFNTDKYPLGQHPKSWAEFWDAEKFPGPRVIDAGTWVVPPIEYILLADGVEPENLYPLDFDRAYKSLDKIKPHVVKFATSSAQAPQALVDGEAHLAAATMGRIAALKEEGAPVDFTWDEALLGVDYWIIPKGAKNYENAVKFIEFASRPEILAEFTKRMPLGPANLDAFEYMSEERAKMLPTYPENLEKQILIDAEWWAQTDSSGKSNIERNYELWNAWVLQ